ncbi:homospermidine synthase [Legionella oakridgensis]|uniref:Homospermidine synthase n=1 Tax=Legionella oakridgensis TaxID=29423 RepID=A0A0W0X5C7_9GAMM|nr:saccharopine dehydrogenase C-terminal domain-containing protein [Legionella oakridgensis]ETO93503.1 homospermidine synthase [Legionella oakridgensis RV-2-2007]KTD39813.1 homospermidine synthase [Legionella oakridgensis]STY19907.1 homospermidine synthase [Legionella longbeachae]
MVNKKKIRFNNRILIIGFGSIGQALLPLLFKHLEIHPEQITILTKDEEGLTITQEFGISLQLTTITEQNYLKVLANRLGKGDLLLNLSIDISSISLIRFCQQKEVLYLDLCIEPWAGFYDNSQVAPSARTNYLLRESALQLKSNKSTTAVLTHGANPGLVSHFVKQALLNMAHDNEISCSLPTTSAEWANLAMKLNIKAIHIAERDTQISNRPKKPGEFVNTWSANGFISEALQPAELGWGTHERHWPSDAGKHDHGQQGAIYLNRPGASVRVRSWTPGFGPFHGFLITHSESMSLADYLTLKDENQVSYRPTVHYAYLPCPLAELSLHELAGKEWQKQKNNVLMMDDIMTGTDELGVLLMGNKRGAYWYGSQLSIQEARQLAPHNNATTLQVAAGTLAGLLWLIEHPNKGLVEPEDLDFKYILDIATPYLGKVGGFYTDWTPLTHRESLFPENVDRTDPWQFINIRVG